MIGRLFLAKYGILPNYFQFYNTISNYTEYLKKIWAILFYLHNLFFGIKNLFMYVGGDVEFFLKKLSDIRDWDGLKRGHFLKVKFHWQSQKIVVNIVSICLTVASFFLKLHVNTGLHNHISDDAEFFVNDRIK